MKVECIDFRKLRGQNPLFLKYLYEYDQVGSFYPRPAHLDLEHLKSRAETVRSAPARCPREDLVGFLTGFNQKLGAGEATFKNLEKLKKPPAVAVVTGHQLGFLGGPSFIVYKAIAAVRLAQILEEQGQPAVPVFWLASDDSDFEEVRTTTFFGRENGLASVAYPKSTDGAQMVGTLRLDSASECLEQWNRQGVFGEFQGPVRDLLGDAYRPGKTFSEGLGSWLGRLFEAYGLIFFDGLLPNYKSAAQEVFRIAVEKRDLIVKALSLRNRELDSSGFAPQVHVEDTESFLFWIEGNRRYKLESKGGAYFRKNRKRADFQRDQLLKGLGTQMDHFSPNVLLRPILQDYLLPTAVYMGGPSEIAYFAQVNSISAFWGLEAASFPRTSVSIVDRKTQRLLDRYDLKVLDILSLPVDEITRRILKQKADSSEVLGRLEGLRKDLDNDIGGLRTSMERLDPTVANMLDGAQKKMRYQLEKVERRFVVNQRTLEATLGRHLDYLYTRLLPNGVLQERVINFNQFVSEEGLDLVHRLTAALKPFCPSHQIVYL